MIRYLAFIVFLVIMASGTSVVHGWGNDNAFASVDTIVPKNISRDTLKMDTVAIAREKLAPDSIYKKKQQEYRTIYLWGDNKKPIQINPLGGILININKVYSHFSKKGKESRRLQRIFKAEHEDDLINTIWRPYTVDYAPLKGDSLLVFQTYFKPSYKWFSKATHYEKLAYITASMRLYRDSTEMIHQALKLPKITFK